MTPDNRIARPCRTCKAAVLWRNHVRTGKPAPIDVIAGDKPNVELVGSDQYRLVAAGEGTTTNHWATCPDRGEWRARVLGAKAAAS